VENTEQGPPKHKTSRFKTKWIVLCVTLAAILLVALLIGASLVRKSYEPYLRDQAIAYLQKRFQCDVQLTSLRIGIPYVSPLRLLTTGGHGTILHVQGTGLALRKTSDPDSPPIMAIQEVRFDVDAGNIFEKIKTVDRVEITGVTITIPPKDERAEGGTEKIPPNVSIREVIARDVTLAIVPAIKGKQPLTFAIASLDLVSAGPGQPMSYRAELTNPKPRGLIHSSGTFGPWVAEEPGDTHLSGTYTFDHADLSVFPAIAGILHSTGEFQGTLSAISAKGEATVPDFRLRTSGNAVALSTRFQVLVDGQNGNTTLQPVEAVLGSTRFTTGGAVIRKNGERQRTISLRVSIPAGNLKDVLRLAMKGTPMMEGKLSLHSSILIPPLSAKVSDKLILDGDFRIDSGHFLRADIQGKIDSLSRRGQGQPKSTDIGDVFSDMKGSFHLQDQTIEFRTLSFNTPGAAINLAGAYNLREDTLDFRGSLRLQAKISQTMTGWKRWALKPADPFFAKNGAGTFLRIRIDGDSQSPRFGLDHSKP
jgi:hypothetical protein